MYELIFYEDKNGKSPVRDYLDVLKEKAETSKDARINREKILSCFITVLRKPEKRPKRKKVVQCGI